MKLSRLILPLFCGCAVLGMATSCSNVGNQDEKASSIATIACDASFENIISQEIDVFEYIYPERSVIPYYIDEHAAIDSLLEFKVKMAVTTRPLTAKELDYLKSKKKIVRQQRIAVDAIALIVNPANPTEMIDRKDLVDILSGKLTRWDQVVPQADRMGDISVVFDHQGSSTVEYMRDSLLNGAKITAPKVFAQGSSEAVFEAVAANKNAIGVIGVSWISGDMNGRELTREEMVAASSSSSVTDIAFDNDVKVLKVQADDKLTAYKPYQYYIFTGDYPLHRQIYMISTGVPRSASHAFYSFVTGPQGQKLIQMTGVLPTVIRPQFVEVN